MRANALIAVLLIVVSSHAHAQASSPKAPSLSETIDNLRPSKSVKGVIDALTEDIPMTTAPATFVLGVASEQVPRYTTFREFAVGIGRGLGEDGTLKNSVSAEIAPALALRALTLDDLTNGWLRAIARTTFSVATIAGSSEAPAKASYGVQSILYSKELDQAISTAGSSQCTEVGRNFRKTAKATTGDDDPDVPEFTKEDNELKQKCQASIDLILNRWNQTMVAAGFGQALASEDNKPADLKKANKVLWLTGSIGFDFGKTQITPNERMGALLTLHLRSERDSLTTIQGAKPALRAEDVDLYGINFRIGKSRFSGILEYSDRRSKVEGLPDESRRRSLIGAEYKIQKDLYLSFAVGAGNGRRDGKNTTLSLANLKWGFGDNPILAK